MIRLAPFQVRGATAVLTGAAGGIGAALAGRLARDGADLILVDRRQAELDAAADRLRAGGAKPLTVVADLADRQQVRDLTDRLSRDLDRLDLLVNNAGVAMAGRFDEVSAEEFDWLVQIDLLSPIMITRGLLPLLTARPGGHLVNVSSVFGLHGPYGQAPYATAKFGLRGFTQSVAAELAETGTGVTCVLPGGIATGIASAARIPAALDTERVGRQKQDFERLLRYPPDRAATKIISAVVRRRRQVLVGPDARIYDLAARISPGLLARVMHQGARRSETKAS